MFIRQLNRDMEAVNVKSIGCGAFHSLVVISPHVYSCGLNNYGQVPITPLADDNSPSAWNQLCGVSKTIGVY